MESYPFSIGIITLHFISPLHSHFRPSIGSFFTSFIRSSTCIKIYPSFLSRAAHRHRHHRILLIPHVVVQHVRDMSRQQQLEQLMNVVKALPIPHSTSPPSPQIRRVELLNAAFQRQQVQIQIEHAQHVYRSLSVRQQRLHVLSDVATRRELADFD